MKTNEPREERSSALDEAGQAPSLLSGWVLVPGGLVGYMAAGGVGPFIPDTISAWACLGASIMVFGGLGLWCRRPAVVLLLALLPLAAGSWFSHHAASTSAADPHGLAGYAVLILMLLCITTSVPLMLFRRTVRGGVLALGSAGLLWIGVVFGRPPS